MRRYPYSFVSLTALGIAAAIPGLFSLAGFGALLHPVLDDPMAGLAFIVTAVALIGSGLFPYVIARVVNQQQ
ncbi:MAG TPA: hypothetical protein VFF03_12330 [Rhodocyclaceae bacterium]|nr:hypothetical protein [Rhodocyclaceae bacterium]